MILFNKRKYITVLERDVFLRVSEGKNINLHLLCRVLYETGARISECLNLQPQDIDVNDKYIYIESLKKRKKGVFRRIPLSAYTIELIREYIIFQKIQRKEVIWNWSRMTAYRLINQVMLEAGISSDHASPKALRHAFAVSAIEAGIPLTLIQRWLGHADIKTTSIYTDLVGDEERTQASRLWNTQSKEPLTSCNSSFVTKEIAVSLNSMVEAQITSDNLFQSQHEKHNIYQKPKYGLELSKGNILKINFSKKIISNDFDELRKQVEIFIGENLYNPCLNVSFISDQISISKSKIYQIFKLDGGPGHYISKKRLTVAFEMITSTTRCTPFDLKSIACNLGFSSQRSFSEAFFIQFGYYPSRLLMHRKAKQI